MNCPVCGSKIKDDSCKYCKITRYQIENASNIEAKHALSRGDKEHVYNSNYLPKDVNRKKLILYTVFFGAVGINDFYLGKKYKGLFKSISWALTLLLIILSEISKSNDLGAENGLVIILNVMYYLLAIILIMWVHDITMSLLKRTKVPVILAEPQTAVYSKPRKTTKKQINLKD